MGNETAAAVELDVLALKSVDSENEANKQIKHSAGMHNISVNN